MKKYVLIVMLVFATNLANSQRVAVSSDALGWLTLSPNFGADIVLSDRMSFNFRMSYNPFNSLFSGLKLKHVSFTPEARYWFKRPLYSHYLGVHLNFTAYDVMCSEKMAKGMFAAIGVGYGYSFIIAKRWNLTPSVGVGVGVRRGDGSPGSGDNSLMKNQIIPVVTNVGLSISYIIN